jgi:alanine racemase
VRAATDGAVKLIGAWSHLAFADLPGHPFTHIQANELQAAVTVAEHLGAQFSVKHLANSAAVLTAPATHFDLVRPGIALFGLSPSPAIGSAEGLGLRPAMTVRARLALVKDVEAGRGVSYAHSYVTRRKTRLGLVPLGYADGIPRAASSTGPSASPADAPPSLAGSAWISLSSIWLVSPSRTQLGRATSSRSSAMDAVADLQLSSGPERPEQSDTR